MEAMNRRRRITSGFLWRMDSATVDEVERLAARIASGCTFVQLSPKYIFLQWRD
jgi:hypothetical protein